MRAATLRRIRLQRSDPGCTGWCESRQRRTRRRPGFATADRPIVGVASAAKPLPAGSRISYQTVSCGNDGAATTCVDSRNQSGFVISPTGSWVFGEESPLLYRPEGTNPYMN